MKKRKSDRGLFITFEGGEGAGKSTLITRLHEHFASLPTIITREPGGTLLGKKVREILLEKQDISLSSRAELLLFLADRAEHVQSVLLPALDTGKIILCDRFTDSTFAYQGAARKIEKKHLQELCDFATDTLKPDLTLYLDVDPETGLKRASGTGDRIEKESLQFHHQVRDGFLSLAKENPERIKVIDATQPIEAVFSHATSYIQPMVYADV